jgi:predicted lipoprotein with Yx(FWY)xxD motif
VNSQGHVRRVGRAAALFIVVVSTLCLAACGSVSSPGTSRLPSAATAKSASKVSSRSVKGLGRILINGRGFTLYAYVPDNQGPSKCYKVCAVEWPPLLLPAGSTRPSAGPGVRSALLGTTRRADGRLQVTYNRWPLYLYKLDGAPGEITGQGASMGLWYLVGVGGSLDRQPLPSGQ